MGARGPVTSRWRGKRIRLQDVQNFPQIISRKVEREMPCIPVVVFSGAHLIRDPMRTNAFEVRNTVVPASCQSNVAGCGGVVRQLVEGKLSTPPRAGEDESPMSEQESATIEKRDLHDLSGAGAMLPQDWPTAHARGSKDPPRGTIFVQRNLR